MPTSVRLLTLVSLSLPLHQYSDLKISILESRPRSSSPQNPSRHSGYNFFCPLTHREISIISIDLLFEIQALFEDEQSLQGIKNFKRSPSNTKALMKMKTPPWTPSTAHSLVPLSGTHWRTVLVSAPVTHFPYSSFSLPIALSFPFLLAAVICMMEMSRGLQSINKKIFPSTLHVVHHTPTVPPSDTRHDIVFVFWFLYLM